MANLQALNHAQRQRLEFIESVAFWEGVVGRTRVSDAFSVSENHITRDFAFYRQAFPGNLGYDISARVYRPGPQFKPRLSSGSPEEYLSLLRTYLESQSTAVLTTIGGGVDAATLPSPHGALDRTILKDITRALRQKHGLRVKYQSLSSPEPGVRDVWPHALVHAGVRWHVRAFDSKRESFIDLNLLRFLSTKVLLEPSPKSPSEDLEWRNEIDIDVLPARALTRTQQAVIAAEYGMKEIGRQWIWRAKVKECLAGYFIRRLRLDLNERESHPLVLRHPELAKKYRFGEQ